MSHASPRPLFIGSGWTDTKDFGQLLRWRRLASERSADEVAEHADITAAFLRAIERGDRAPSEKTAVALLDALDIEHTMEPGTGSTRGDLEITDPRTNECLLLQFKAAHKGDSVSWTLRDQQPGLHLWRSAPSGSELIEADALLGKIIRKLANSDPGTLQKVAALLDPPAGK